MWKKLFGFCNKFALFLRHCLLIKHLNIARSINYPGRADGSGVPRESSNKANYSAGAAWYGCVQSMMAVQ